MSQKQLIGGLTVVAALGAAIGLALQGCGGDGGAGSTGAPRVQRRAVRAKVKGFDPATSGDLYSSGACVQIYEPLYEFHYLKRNPFVLIPLTAAAQPTVSEDRLTLTIPVKKGIRFHDDDCFPGGRGRELVAQDFIYAWKRIADPKVKSPLWGFLQGNIVGLDEFREAAEASEQADYDAPVAGLTASESHTLVIRLARLNPQFQMILAMPFTAAVPREAVQKYGDGFLNHAVGTGAFRLAEWVRDSRYVLVRNPDYHDMRYPDEGEHPSSNYAGDAAEGFLEWAGQRVPLCDRVEASIIVEDQPYWLEFVTGKADVTAIPKDAFGQAIAGSKVSSEMSAKGVTLRRTPDLDLTYIAFNMSDPVVGGEEHKLLRRAISCAMNVAKVRELFHNDRGLFAQSIIPPGLFGYDPGYQNPNTYNLERAKQFLAEAGYPEGKGLPELTYDSSGTDSTSRNMAELIQTELAAIGIKCRIESQPWPAFDKKINEGRAQFWGVGWGADYPDPENFLQLLYGPNSAPNGQNGSRFQHAEYDQLYERMRVLPDGDERRQLIRRMVAIAEEHQPVVYELHREAWVLSNPWCPNYKYPLVTNGYLKYVWVDMEERKRRIGE